MSSTAPSDSTAPHALADGDGHLRRVLGLPSLVLFGLVYMVPLTVFTTYGIVTETTGGRLAVAYVVTLVAMVSLLAIVIDLATLASLISFGALVAFSAVNLSVIKHYFVDARERAGGAVVNNLLLPLIGFALTVWLWTSLSSMTLVVGLCWLAAGFVWLLAITRGFRRPTPVLDMKE
jgi:putrescine importer